MHANTWYDHLGRRILRFLIFQRYRRRLSLRWERDGRASEHAWVDVARQQVDRVLFSLSTRHIYYAWQGRPSPFASHIRARNQTGRCSSSRVNFLSINKPAGRDLPRTLLRVTGILGITRNDTIHSGRTRPRPVQARFSLPCPFSVDRLDSRVGRTSATIAACL